MTDNNYNKHVHSRFLRFVRKYPDQPALRFRLDGQWLDWSYAELCGRTSHFFSELQARGIKPGDAVGLMASRRPDTIAAMAAILSLGARYVPLDPHNPESRLRDFCDDAGVVTIVAAKGTSPKGMELDGLFELDVDLAPPSLTAIGVDGELELEPDAAACILFTSGSTGRPKGVIIPHRGIVRMVDDPNYMPVGPDIVFLHHSVLSFDASMYEIWVPLLNGGIAVLYPEELLRTRDALAATIRATGVNHLFLTTTLFHQMFDGDGDGKELNGIRSLTVAGEVMSVAHARRAADLIPNTQIINGYGPTENTMATTCFTIPNDLPADLERVPIGIPVTGTEVVIVDEQLRPVATGVEGELVVLGDGVALGYLNRPELTRDLFVDIDTGDGTLRTGYRTGDRAYKREDGLFEFKGRLDDQVKIEGHRIEPGEIESRIERIAEVDSCRVLARKGPAGQIRLAAYVVCNQAIEEEDLRQILAADFPAYMIPHFTYFLDMLPTNAHGKLDTKSLPDPFQEAVQASTAELEGGMDIVVSAWVKVLGYKPASGDVNFFDAGGTSLNAIQLHEILCMKLGRALDPTFIFENPTVRRQSVALQQGNASTDEAVDRGARRRAAQSGRARARS